MFLCTSVDSYITRQLFSMNHLLINNKSNCSACTACMNICPKQAIFMKSDENGFLYPDVNTEKCIDCGLCLQVCNYQKINKRCSDKETYAAATKDTNPLQSASGGIFASLATHVLQAKGIVYGCAMCNDNGFLTPKHMRIDKKADLHLLQGSKYVHSEMGLTYQRVKSDLENSKNVLFSGTPCQVDGLRGFLRKDYDNLYTIDIICHGVPSIQLFHDYLCFTERKKQKNIVDFKFRDKSDGWRLHGKMVLEDSAGNRQTEFFEPEQSSYYQMFLNSYTYRENCYSCPYASDKRPGDITIGDYWCIDLVHPEMLMQNGGCFDEKKGISCLIVNREQGNKLLNMYGSGIERRKSTFENAAKYNGQLTHSSPLKTERAVVMKKYAKGYNKLDKWYQRRMIPIKMTRRIRAIVPKWVKDAVKKLR